jgi:hypothetical protein
MKYTSGFYIAVLVLLLTSCKPYELDPALSGYANMDPGELSFINQAGDKQIVNVNVKRGLHGTGPFGPEQRSLQVSYLPSLAIFNFYLEVDGDDGHYNLALSTHEPRKDGPGSDIFLLPCQNNWGGCESRTKMHDQILINGKVFHDVLSVSVGDSFEGPFSTQDWDQGFDSLYLAKQQGLVGFTNNQGDAFSLEK